MPVKILVFILMEGLIFFHFRKEIRLSPGHGFYIFFAFETLLAQGFIHFDFLFFKPGGPLQVIFSLFFAGSALFALSGFYGLKKFGKPVNGWEQTTHLVTQGIYRHIRHPLYSSLIMLSLGIWLKRVSLWSTLLCLMSIVLLIKASHVEEKENIEKFGSVYLSYKKATKVYLPFLL